MIRSFNSTSHDDYKAGQDIKYLLCIHQQDMECLNVQVWKAHGGGGGVWSILGFLD
jgi:hypothetical protein